MECSRQSGRQHSDTDTDTNAEVKRTATATNTKEKEWKMIFKLKEQHVSLPFFRRYIQHFQQPIYIHEIPFVICFK